MPDCSHPQSFDTRESRPVEEGSKPQDQGLCYSKSSQIFSPIILLSTKSLCTELLVSLNQMATYTMPLIYKMGMGSEECPTERE